MERPGAEPVEDTGGVRAGGAVGEGVRLAGVPGCVDLAVRSATVLLGAALDDVELLHPGGQQEDSHREEPEHQQEVEQEGEEREDEGARDVPDGPAGLPDHVRGHGDPPEAAAEEEGEEGGHTAEHQDQTQPEVLAGGDGLADPLHAGEEDVLLLVSPGPHLVELTEREAGQASRQTDRAAEDADPDCRHGTAVEQTWRQTSHQSELLPSPQASYLSRGRKE